MGDREMEKYGIEYHDLVNIAKLAVSRPIFNKASANMTHDSSQTNHVKGSQVGSIAKEVKDNAQVSNSQFNQNNNANTTELLKLISSIRETADQFPEGIREGIIIDIEDVETEIKKPENQWNKTRLKKSLTALVAAGTAFGVGIAGMADFADNVIDVSHQLGIELKLPPAL